MNSVKELLWQMIERMSDPEARQLLEFAQHLQMQSGTPRSHNQTSAIGKGKALYLCSKHFPAELIIQVERVEQGKPPPPSR
jgi:hypothetical protein